MQEVSMAETTTITVRIPAATKAKLDRLAEATRRSRSFLAAEALDSYAQSELAIVEGILRGLDDARQGNVVPHEQAMIELRTRVARASQKVKKRSA
jgi:predicted transcriptional regulator